MLERRHDLVLVGYRYACRRARDTLSQRRRSDRLLTPASEQHSNDVLPTDRNVICGAYRDLIGNSSAGDGLGTGASNRTNRHLLITRALGDFR